MKGNFAFALVLLLAASGCSNRAITLSLTDPQDPQNGELEAQKPQDSKDPAKPKPKPDDPQITTKDFAISKLVTTDGKEPPVDILLILDVSWSMRLAVIKVMDEFKQFISNDISGIEDFCFAVIPSNGWVSDNPWVLLGEQNHVCSVDAEGNRMDKTALEQKVYDTAVQTFDANACTTTGGGVGCGDELLFESLASFMRRNEGFELMQPAMAVVDNGAKPFFRVGSRRVLFFVTNSVEQSYGGIPSVDPFIGGINAFFDRITPEGGGADSYLSVAVVNPPCDKDANLLTCFTVEFGNTGIDYAAARGRYAKFIELSPEGSLYKDILKDDYSEIISELGAQIKRRQWIYSFALGEIATDAVRTVKIGKSESFDPVPKDKYQISVADGKLTVDRAFIESRSPDDRLVIEFEVP